MICHSIASLSISAGGPSRSVSKLCKALAIKNESVCILTLSDADKQIVNLDSSVYLKTIDTDSSLLLRLLKSSNIEATLHELNSEEKIQLIHQNGIWLPFNHEIALVARRYYNIPTIVSPRGMLESCALNKSKWKKRLAWRLYQKRDLQFATAFHATSYSEAKSIRRLGFRQPIAVIPNGVEMPSLKTGALNLKDARKKTRKALFLSRINPIKGLLMLLEAWKQLKPKGWCLIVAGNDDSGHLPLVNRKIQEFGLSDQVEIVGPLFDENKRSAYLEADIFILPSYSENFGIVVAEALSHGLPVLTTTGCPWQELQIHDCGWWVEPTLDGVMSGLEMALATKKEQLVKMGMRGRKLVEKNYQWSDIADKMNTFYRWVIYGGKPPDFIFQ